MKSLPDPKHLHECFSYNPETGVLTWRHRPESHFKNTANWVMWNKQRAGSVAGAATAEGYLVVTVDSRQLKVHRVAVALQTGVWPCGTVDHRNGDKADNRWNNLRDVPTRLNNQNRVRANRDNACGVLGVYWDKWRGKWRANLNVNGKQKNCGRFDTKEAAHAAYVEAKRKLHEGCTL